MGQKFESETVSAAEVGSFESLCDKGAPLPCVCPGSGCDGTVADGTCMSLSRSTQTAASSSERSSCPTSGVLPRLVRLELIDVADDLNGRLDVDPESASRLAKLIQSQGLLHAITLRRMGTRFELIAGRNRLRAFEVMRWPEIPAVVLECDQVQAGTIRLAENVARSTLSAVEEAKQLAPLVANHPKGVDGVAADIGRRAEWILDRIDMCEWPGSLLEHVHCRRLSIGAARRLARIEPPAVRDERIAQAALHGINVQTAALWLQDSERMAGADADGSAAPVVLQAAEYQTETTVRCFGCAEMVPLTSTIAMRVCNGCLREIQQARSRGVPDGTVCPDEGTSAPPVVETAPPGAPPGPAEQSPMLTPPVYDPPRPGEPGGPAL